MQPFDFWEQAGVLCAGIAAPARLVLEMGVEQQIDTNRPKARTSSIIRYGGGFIALCVLAIPILAFVAALRGPRTEVGARAATGTEVQREAGDGAADTDAVVRFLQAAAEDLDRAATSCWAAVMCGDASGLRGSVQTFGDSLGCIEERLSRCLADAKLVERRAPPPAIADMWRQLYFLQVGKNIEHVAITKETLRSEDGVMMHVRGRGVSTVEDWAAQSGSRFATRYAILRERESAASQDADAFSRWLKARGVCLPERYCYVNQVMSGTPGHVVRRYERR
jgi:hypothetical protein